jgi:hypothetical protein
MDYTFVLNHLAKLPLGLHVIALSAPFHERQSRLTVN